MAFLSILKKRFEYICTLCHMKELLHHPRFCSVNSFSANLLYCLSNRSLTDDFKIYIFVFALLAK